MKKSLPKKTIFTNKHHHQFHCASLYQLPPYMIQVVVSSFNWYVWCCQILISHEVIFVRTSLPNVRF